ncbi:hypothetical protein F5Y09DRAFT_89302 [Xylaria sp. FL1042]|nr:hypothetical protein F5Y09DRAFT_89302 [Xylaria sp. FL1042]
MLGVYYICRGVYVLLRAVSACNFASVFVFLFLRAYNNNNNAILLLCFCFFFFFFFFLKVPARRRSGRSRVGSTGDDLRKLMIE